MPQVNDAFLRLPGSYLFAEIRRRVDACKATNPNRSFISLGIGDVTRPLVPAIIDALHKAVDEMAQAETFRGYGPEQGYDFLRQAIAKNDYAVRGVNIDPDEIFISDGAKCDVGHFQDLFAADTVVALTDPVYPVYADTNAMANRAGHWDGTRWDGLIYLPCVRENDFVPDFPKQRPDIIYLCYPNNPTGTVLNRAALKAWVEYAQKIGAVILYDSAYEAFITEPDVPHSIFEIEGAREVAVEFRSFSKIAGFTGLRCAYVTIPKELVIHSAEKGKISLHSLWLRHQSTRFNGCAYVVQRAAEAVFSPEGYAQCMENIRGYMKNAADIRQGVVELGLEAFGGVNAPYIWLQTPNGEKSWDFFERLLNNTGLICTPGSGFGPSGEGYARLTAFGTAEQTAEAIQRLKQF